MERVRDELEPSHKMIDPHEYDRELDAGFRRSIENNARFRIRLRAYIEDGILIAVKYSIVVAALLLTVNYMLEIRQMALNGQAAAELIREYQVKGWLPSLPVPVRDETNK